MTLNVYSTLLVEDHPLVRRALRQLLEGEAGFSVVAEAESAESALAQLPNVTPDLVLTDLSLPGASGLELVAMLKQERPELPCLVITGHADPFYRTASLSAGAVGLVPKGDPDEVLMMVRRVLNGTLNEPT